MRRLRAPKPVRRDDAIRGVPSSCGHSGAVRGRVAALAGPAAHDAIPGARPAIEEWKCLAELIDTAFDDFNESMVSLF
jgi:hypothetical protein